MFQCVWKNAKKNVFILLNRKGDKLNYFENWPFSRMAMTSSTHMLKKKKKKSLIPMANSSVLKRLFTKEGLLCRGTNAGIWKKSKLVHLVLLYELSSHTKSQQENPKPP